MRISTEVPEGFQPPVRRTDPKNTVATFTSHILNLEPVSGLPLLGEVPSDLQGFFLLGESMLWLGSRKLDAWQLRIRRSLEAQPNIIIPVLESDTTHAWMCYWDWNEDNGVNQDDISIYRPIKKSLESIAEIWRIQFDWRGFFSVILKELIKNTRDHGTGKAVFMIYQNDNEYIFTYREWGLGILSGPHVQSIMKSEHMSDTAAYQKVLAIGNSSKSNSGRNAGIGTSWILGLKGADIVLYDGGKKVCRGTNGDCQITDTEHTAPWLLYTSREKSPQGDAFK